MGFWEIALYALGLLVAAFVIYYRIVLLPEMLLRAEKKRYQDCGEVILVRQDFEGDDEFLARVRRMQARFLDSGNRFAQRQNPVVGFPRNAYFEVEWFDTKYRLSTVGRSQMEYERAAFEFYVLLCKEWSRQLYGSLKQDLQMEAANGQKPFDVDKIWEEY